MKKFLKLLLPTVLALLLALSMLTACDNGAGSNPTGATKPPATPSEREPEEEEEPEETEEPEEEEETVQTADDYNAFVAKMELTKNYTYTLTENGTKEKYEIDGETVLINEYEIYLYREDGKSYRLDFNNGDGKYHKTLADEYDENSYILADMKTASVNGYSAETKSFSVTLGGDDFDLTLTEETAEFSNAQKTLLVSNVGTTSVEFPRDKFIINDVKEPSGGEEQPEQPDDPTVPEEKMYTVNTDGERVYNDKLLGQTLLQVMSAEYEDGQTVYEKYTYNMGISVDEIIFVSTEGDTIQIGAISQLAVNKIVEVFNIEKTYLSEVGDSIREWTETITELTVNYSIMSFRNAINYDVSVEQEHNEELKRIAVKALNKVATDGVQTNVNTQGTPQPRFENSEILFVYEGNDGLDGTAGLGLGNTQRRQIVAVVKDADGQAVFIIMNIATTNLDTWENSILNESNNINNKFVVYKMDRADNVDNSFYD